MYVMYIFINFTGTKHISGISNTFNSALTEAKGYLDGLSAILLSLPALDLIMRQPPNLPLSPHKCYQPATIYSTFLHLQTLPSTPSLHIDQPATIHSTFLHLQTLPSTPSLSPHKYYQPATIYSTFLHLQTLPSTPSLSPHKYYQPATIYSTFLHLQTLPSTPLST
jgi:hypothetical protein